MTNTLLLLPTHLYNFKIIKSVFSGNKIIIWEHPHYFLKYKYNKKKLMLHRASMRKYYDDIKKIIKHVSYVNFNQKIILRPGYFVFDPIDKIKLPSGGGSVLTSPNFLLPDYEEYRSKTDKFFFTPFYMWAKKKLDLLPDIKSTDSENRNKLPSDIKINDERIPHTSQYVIEATNYVNKHFPDNYGNTDNFVYSIDRKGARQDLSKFITERLCNFGKYQDAIHSEYNYLYHSLLSSSLNIGLINPDEVAKVVVAMVGKVSINNIEGFIRQLFWREYQRYCYIYISNFSGNYFNNYKKINSKWYDGTTGIDPVDKCIRNGFDTGYLHHIERLMVVGNFMNLSRIYPKDGYRWFMEFSCDSYDWVMCQNVYEMVFFISGGMTMRRPYVSSANYIINMSNYKRSESWVEKWNSVYRKFVNTHRNKLKKFRYNV
jgi:deoxyribodipyrimidine photolyase-related protein